MDGDGKFKSEQMQGMCIRLVLSEKIRDSLISLAQVNESRGVIKVHTYADKKRRNIKNCEEEQFKIKDNDGKISNGSFLARNTFCLAIR